MFSANTPEPATAMPAVPPIATAAEPANTIASIDWVALAVRLRSPSVRTLVSSRNAFTSAGIEVPSGR